MNTSAVELGLYLTIAGVLRLFLFRMLRWYLVVWSFMFFRAKSVGRLLIDRTMIMKKGEMRPCTARWDARCGIAERRTPIANCELDGGRSERDVAHAHFTSK